MKRIISAFFCVLFVSASLVCVLTTDVNAISTSAQACVLIDAENLEVLYAHNESERLKMASTTKIMTTLIALEQAQKRDDVVTFTEEMVAEGSSMYLQVGDKVTLSQLAAGMMMASGNDAANAVAIHIGKSFEGFAKLMNKRSEEIGMNNTSFVTPSGLDDDNHYSTAYDMALLMAVAMKNSAFAELTSCKQKQVDFIYPEDRVVTYANHNKLLSRYEYCTGGKTGYTDSAGRCLVSSAEKDGAKLIAVTLNASDDWNDHINLYDYGFSLYTKTELKYDFDKITLSVAGGGTSDVKVMMKSELSISVLSQRAEDIYTRLYMPSFVYAPLNREQKVGEIVFLLDGKEIARQDVVSISEVLID